MLVFFQKMFNNLSGARWLCHESRSGEGIDPIIQEADDNDALKNRPWLMIQKDGAGPDLELIKGVDPGYPGDVNEKLKSSFSKAMNFIEITKLRAMWKKGTW